MKRNIGGGGGNVRYNMVQVRNSKRSRKKSGGREKQRICPRALIRQKKELVSRSRSMSWVHLIAQDPQLNLVAIKYNKVQIYTIVSIWVQLNFTRLYTTYTY